MKLTELEAERLNHIATRKQLLQLSAALVARDEAAVADAVRARLGLVGDFAWAQDGTVTGTTAPEVHPE